MKRRPSGNIMKFFAPKTEKKPEEKPVLQPDAMVLLLDLANRVEKLEKDVLKWHLKQSPGRPKNEDPAPPQDVVSIGGRVYKTK